LGAVFGAIFGGKGSKLPKNLLEVQPVEHGGHGGGDGPKPPG